MQDHVCVHGGKYSVDPNLVKIDFSSSINPFGVSDNVLHKLRLVLKEAVSIYPDPDCKLLKQNLIDFLDIDIDENWLFCGNGATEIIHIFARAFSKMKSLIPIPTFCEYEIAAKRNLCPVKFVQSHNLRFDADDILEYSKGCSIIFLCNPNNPTGLLQSDVIEKIIDQVDSSKLIILDESFIELISYNHHNSMIKKLSNFDNLVILRSMTKTYGLAGLRIGYCIANPKIITKMSQYLISWNVNGLAQLSAIYALKDNEYIKKTVQYISNEKSYFINSINSRCKSAIGYGSDSNFFLIELCGKNSSTISHELLTNYGILVRDCSSFRGMNDRFIRVAVKLRTENSKLINAMEQICP